MLGHVVALLSASIAEAQDKHFDPKGKLPSESTMEVQEQQRAILPFHDQRNFEEQKKSPFSRLGRPRPQGIDTGERGEFVLELSNGTLTNIERLQADDPDLTVNIDRVDLEPVTMGAVSFDDHIEAGKPKWWEIRFTRIGRKCSSTWISVSSSCGGAGSDDLRRR